MKVVVVTRSGRTVLEGLELPDGAPVSHLQEAIHKHSRKLHPVRQRLTLKEPDVGPAAKPVVLDPRKKLSDYSDAKRANGADLVVVVKDLGPQIGYQTVFFWEYFGPLVIYPLFYLFPSHLYGALGSSPAVLAAHRQHPVQAWALLFWTGHYGKRILETFFVHRFSHSSMPLANLFRNCAYYWLFAAYVSFFVNHPRYTPVSPQQAGLGLALGVIAELCNLHCHVVLRNLRPLRSAGGYVIPRGTFFEYVTCPNYTAEILAWLGFNIATQTLAGYLFMLAGAYQMTVWALQKHRRLVKLFDGVDGRDKYPRRWVIMPPVL